MWIPSLLFPVAVASSPCDMVHLPDELSALTLEIQSNQLGRADRRVGSVTDRLEQCGLDVTSAPAFVFNPHDGLLVLWGLGAYAAYNLPPTPNLPSTDRYLDFIARMDPPRDRVVAVTNWTGEILDRYDQRRSVVHAQDGLGELDLQVAVLVDGELKPRGLHEMPVGRHVVQYVGRRDLELKMVDVTERGVTSVRVRDGRTTRLVSAIAGTVAIATGTTLLLTEYGARQVSAEDPVPVGMAGVGLVGLGVGGLGFSLTFRPEPRVVVDVP